MRQLDECVFVITHPTWISLDQMIAFFTVMLVQHSIELW
jgi:hypothetical protein